MKKEQHILLILPHPDDESFGAGGTIAAHIENGSPITYACLTLGEMGRNMGNPPFANRESLASIRKKELLAATNILGIQDVRLMGFRDKTIEFEDETKIVRMISNLISEVQPSLIITFYPGYGVHPDHDACGAFVVKAVEKLPPEQQPKIHGIAFSHDCEKVLGEADVVHDIRPYAKKKIAAIKAHRSQTALMFEDMETSENIKTNERFQSERFWTYPVKSSKMADNQTR